MASSNWIVRHEETVAGLIRTLDAMLSHRQTVDGIVVARPPYALCALTHLQKRGCRIPGDMALIARMDDPILDFATPRISCYRADAAVFGRQLADGIIEVAESGFGSSRRARQLPVFIPGETV